MWKDEGDRGKERELGMEEEYRVDRVLGFFSNRPNWDPHTHSPKGLWFRGGGGHTRLRDRGRGWEDPNADDWSGQTL